MFTQDFCLRWFLPTFRVLNVFMEEMRLSSLSFYTVLRDVTAAATLGRNYQGPSRVLVSKTYYL